MLWGIELQVLTPWCKKRLLQHRTFYKWDSKHERSGTASRAGMSDIGLCEVLYWFRLHGCQLRHKSVAKGRRDTRGRT